MVYAAGRDDEIAFRTRKSKAAAAHLRGLQIDTSCRSQESNKLVISTSFLCSSCLHLLFKSALEDSSDRVSKFFIKEGEFVFANSGTSVLVGGYYW